MGQYNSQIVPECDSGTVDQQESWTVKQYDACTKRQLIVNNEKAVTKHRLQKFKDRGYLQA